MAKTASVAPAALAALIVALAGCGGGSSGGSSSSASTPPATPAASAPSTTSNAAAPPSSGGGHRLQVAADPSGGLRFTTSSLTAKAGRVSIDFTNRTPVGHNLTIQRATSGPNIGATPTFSAGSKVLTLHLKPGTYTFFCSVPGHRQAGMHGTLVVK